MIAYVVHHVIMIIASLLGFWISYGRLLVWASFWWWLHTRWGSLSSYYRINWTNTSQHCTWRQILKRIF